MCIIPDFLWYLRGSWYLDKLKLVIEESLWEVKIVLIELMCQFIEEKATVQKEAVVTQKEAVVTQKEVVVIQEKTDEKNNLYNLITQSLTIARSLRQKHPEYFKDFELHKEKKLLELKNNSEFMQIAVENNFTEEQIIDFAELEVTKEIIKNSDIESKDPEFVKKFLWNYSSLDYIIWAREKGMKGLVDSDIFVSNRSVKKVVEEKNIGIEFDSWWDWLYDNIVWVDPKSKKEVKQKYVETMVNLTINKKYIQNYMWDLWKKFIWKILMWYSNIDSNMVCDKDSVDMSKGGFEFDYNIEGHVWYMKISKNWKLKMVDQMSGEEWVFGAWIEESKMFKSPSLDEYKESIKKIDVLSIAKISKSERNFVKLLESKVTERTDKVSIDFDNDLPRTVLEIKMKKFVNTNKLISFYKPDSDVYWYWYQWDKQMWKKVWKEKNISLYSYLKIVNNTLNNNVSAKWTKLVGLFQRVEDYINWWEIEFDINKKNLKKYQSEKKDDKWMSWFSSLINMFCMEKEGIRLIDIDKFEQFVISLEKKEEYENKDKSLDEELESV